MFAKFGPDENMQLYGRGIRRRLAPMLGDDRRRIELAYALQFSLRGTPVLRYGEEIGMGEDLTPGRAQRDPYADAVVRCCPTAASPPRPADQLVRPVISGGEFGYEKVNVTAQRHDPTSLLSWFERMIRTLREAPEVGSGTCTHVDVPGAGRACWCTAPTTPPARWCSCTTSADEPGVVDLEQRCAGEAEFPNDVLADQEYPEPGKLDARAGRRLRLPLDPAAPATRLIRRSTLGVRVGSRIRSSRRPQ